jgi:hypothetical protein
MRTRTRGEAREKIDATATVAEAGGRDASREGGLAVRQGAPPILTSY